MELKETAAHFRPAKSAPNQHSRTVSTCIRVAVATERHDLISIVQQTLRPPRYNLMHMETTSIVEKAIGRRLCEICIVDIERQSEWSSSVFSRFDKAAANFPIIMLCRSKHRVIEHLRTAKYANDLVPYETIGDPRFVTLIEAAILRAEISKNHNPCDWSITPLPAA